MLSELIKIFLKLIDEIDHDELIEALRTIVEVFGVEILPHAVELCQKLSEAYLRLMSQKSAGAEQILEEDSETSLTTMGLIGAVHRILYVLSGNV